MIFESNVKRLEKRARDLAKDMGGALMILLALQEPGKISKLQWKDGYFLVDGRRVSVTRIAQQLSRLDDYVTHQMIQLTKKLERGQLTFVEWANRMEELVEESHVLFAAFALGGIATASSNSAVQTRIRIDKNYLRGFERDVLGSKYKKDLRNREGDRFRFKNRQVRFNKDNLHFNKIQRRTRSYVRSASVTFHGLWFDLNKSLGRTEAMRILTANESCTTATVDGRNIEGCLQYGGRWVPIDLMPRIGTLRCGIYCRCFIIFR